MKHSTAQLFLFCRPDKGCDGKIELYRVFWLWLRFGGDYWIIDLKGLKFEPPKKLMLPEKLAGE